MATGALDANGIWQYGEDDSEPTFSGMLNKLASSTSTTVTRLEELSGLTAAQVETAKTNLGVPQRTSAGAVSVTTVANTATSVAVTFPASRFTVAPIVLATGVSANGGGVLKEVSVTSTTSTGFSAVVFRSDVVATVVNWFALQMTPSAAGG